MIATVDLPPPSVPPAEVRERARDILARPEFQPPPRSLWQRFWELVSDLVDDLLSAGGSAEPLIGWAVVALVSAATVALAYRAVRSLQVDAAVGRDEVAVDGARRPPAEWLAAAARHEAEGDWRAAVRAHFRAAVAELAARGVVEEVPGRTTGEYRRAVEAAAPAAAGSFAGLSRLFEDAWYAAAEPGPAEVEQAKVLAGAARGAARR